MIARHQRILSVIVLSLTVTACSGDVQKQPGAGAGAPLAEVDVISVAKVGANLTQDLPGRLQAVRTAQVRARVEGIVEKRLFVEGSDIKAGNLLYKIDSRNYKANVDAAQAEVAAASAIVKRYQPLLDIKAISQQEFEQSQARLKLAEAALTRAQIDLDNCSVPAPISGRIGRAEVSEGALVGKGDATLMATIEQVDPIYANFSQSNSELLHLQQAMKAGKLKRADQGRVELVLEDGSLYPLPGRLLFSDLAVDPNTGSISLRAEFPNPQRELLPGLFVKIRFVQGHAENTIRLPQRAVQLGERGQYVLTVDGEGKVALVPVETSGMSGGDWIVTGGLRGDEKVIVNGIQKVRPGAVVKPLPWNPQVVPITQQTPATPGQPKANK